MRHARSLLTQTALAFGFVLFFSLMGAGQEAAPVPARITEPVNMENRVTLRGNTHPLARPEYDQGAAPDGLPMERILLVLQRSTEQEAALRNLLDEQQMKSSPNYHMWLTPEQFGQQFGPADADIQAVTDWLSSQGFQVGNVAAGRTIIEFSGTAGQVRQALHTEVHKFAVKGEEHWANASDPQIPAALAPVVAGFASLNNFPKSPRVHRLGTFSKSKATGVVTPLFTYPVGTNEYILAVGPADFANIYNVLPLWNGGTDGTGVTIAVSEQSDINPRDVADFRSVFGLSTSGNYLQRIYNGPNPGVLFSSGDESEATLDVQWAGAVARGATVDMVISESTETTAGVDLSALYIIDNNLAPVMSESYGSCEAFNGTAGNDFYNTIWEQGAAQGITVLIASGDSGSAGCDDSSYETAAINGLAIGGDASTPFNVAVGGTDFNEGSGSNWEQYWNYSTSGSVYPSAKSYIPEVTWNDSCAYTGSVTGCASGVSPYGSQFSILVAGGGGQSNCATSTLVSTPQGEEIQCTGAIAKPAWQTGTGVPSDQVRDIPDVSLFAADGANASFYIFCQMDANAQKEGNTSSCDLNAPYLDFQGAGGTSFATPAFAGIMAMVNQKTGQRQGNANYVLYPLAAKTGASCASNSVMAPTASASSCIFYDIQVGNNSVACDAGSLNCGNQTGSGYGILVYTSGSTSVPAWLATGGYDLATGLGTVNAANLVNNWTSVSFSPTSTKLTISPTTFTHGQSVTVSVNVTPASATGDVSLIDCGSLTSSACATSNSNPGIDFLTLTNGAVSSPTILLPGGTYGVMAHYEGNGTYGSSNSTPVTVTVSPEPSKTRVQLVTLACSNGTTLVGSYGATSVPYGYNIVCSNVYNTGYWLRMDVTNASGNVCYNTSTSNPTGIPSYQCPTGQVTLTDNNGLPLDLGAPTGTAPGTYTLNSQGHAEDQFIQLVGGTNSLIASYQGNSSFSSSHGTASIPVTQAATSTTLTASPTNVTTGTSVTLTATVSTTSIGFAPSGTVQFVNGVIPITGTPTPTSVNGSASGYASLTVTLVTTFTANASITAVYVGDINYTTSTSSAVPISFNAGTPDFNLVATPSSLTGSNAISAPGASGSTTIGASALNGFTGAISLSCQVSATMTGGSCKLASPSITPGSTTTLTVYTTAASKVIGLFNSPRWLAPIGGAIFAAFFLLLIPIKKRRLKLAFGSLFLVLLAAAFVACGGGSSSSSPAPTPGTPTGNYTVTVTGTNGSLSHPLNISVNVQ